MQRIAIIGACGSGKSTLAIKLSEITGLELIHLDQEFHLPGWVEREKQEWANIHANLIANDSWIIDGCYSDTASVRIERSNMVILFDLPTWLCLYRVVKRIILNHGKERVDSAAGCKERFDLGFLLYVFKFKRKKMSNLYSIVERRPKNTELYVVKSNKDLKTILQRFNMSSKQGDLNA